MKKLLQYIQMILLYFVEAVERVRRAAFVWMDWMVGGRHGFAERHAPLESGHGRSISQRNGRAPKWTIHYGLSLKGGKVKKQSFCMVTDFLELDEQAFQRLLPDLVAWHSITRNALHDLNEVGSVTVGGFIWIDDGKPGNCEGVSLKIQSK